MFTGIIEEVGTVKAVRPGQMSISAGIVLEGTKLGDSIAVNGVCLTASKLDANSFSVEIMPETLRRTNIGSLRPGHKVNLERAVALGGRLGGHLVQGHVDAAGRVVSLMNEDEAVIAKYTAPPEVMRYIVEKGFIAVDGASLTVTGLDTTSFTVSLVSFTREHTILGSKHPGDLVNLEVDIIAKYVEKLKERRGDITIDLLAGSGFISPS